MKKSKAPIVITLVIIIIILLLGLVGALLISMTPEITMFGEETITIKYGEEYEDEGARADLVERMFGWRKEIPLEVENNLDFTKVGKQDIKYKTHFLLKSDVVKRTVWILDDEPPVITLIEQTDDKLTAPNSRYVEVGVTAFDNVDGDISNKVISREREGYVYYTVTDSHGNTATAERKIRYEGEELKETEEPGEEIEVPPELNDNLFLNDFANLTVQINKITQTNNEISYAQLVKNTYELTTPGTYQIKYTLTDSIGSEIVQTKTVILEGDVEEPEIPVEEPDTPPTVDDVEETPPEAAEYPEVEDLGETMTEPQVSNTSEAEEKVIYLTFDDGPYKNTEKLLDILDKYNAKATFFVTGQYASYQYLIADEYKRGHTVAIHSYSHKYSEIYKSEDAYFADLNKISKLIEDQTGEKPTLVRFPGGSSNSVSKKYSVGIMTKLAAQLETKGYHYFDWNVTSGDAGDTKNANTIYQNVVKGCTGRKSSVVLMHDVKSYTVDAIESILKWGSENGYTFSALDMTTPVVHHKIAN